MRRPVPAMLLALAILAGCAPTGGAGSPAPSSAHSASDVALATMPAPSPRPTGSAPAPAATREPAPTAAPAATRAPTPRSTPTATPTPAPESTPSVPPGRERPDRPYEINLATAADFVPQYTFEWCVGASLQMARSIVTGDREESRASQRRLWELARTLTMGSPYGGANPAGWTAALNDLDLGPYRLVSLPTFDEAVRRAARAIVQTGRPVGLVMWAGRHAWVMTGFTATANPRRDPDARITRVRVMDPLYPHGSRWGASPAPNELIRLKTLARQFVRRDRPDYDFGVDPGWLLVLPVE